MAQLDERIVRVSIEINGQLKVYENLWIRSTGTKYANPLQNEAEIQIANLSKADADYLMTETSPFNKNATPKKIILEAGKKSYGTTKIFEGNIGTVIPSQPPDIILRFKCQANQFLKGKIVSSAQAGSVPLSRIAKQVAADTGLELTFEAKDKNISNYAFTGGALKQVDKLGSIGAVDAFVDGNRLIVKDLNVPLSGHLRILNENSGMVGIPEVTEQGIKATCMLDNQTAIGGALEIDSKIYPTVNGQYAIFKLGWDIASREEPFYWIAEGVRQGNDGKSVVPNNPKKKTKPGRAKRK